MLRKSLAAALVSSFFFLMSGCGSGGSTTTSPPSNTTQLTLSSTALTFAATTIGQSSAAQTEVLDSTGGLAVSVSSVTLSDTTNYSMTGACTGPLNPNATCALTVTFHPQSATSLPATIIITSNSAASPQTVTLAGTGSAAAPTSVLTLSTNMLTFPSTTLGQSSTAQTLTLTDTGTANITINGLPVLTGNTSDFTYTSTCTGSLAPNASCAFNITFVPQATGTRTAVITVTDNATNSPQTVTLTGTGAAVPTPTDTLSSNTIAFTTTTVGKTSASSGVTLTNSGSATLSGISLNLGGTNAADFAETTTCGATLANGSSCNISATFTPSTAAPETATITLTDNAADSPKAITLTGTGTTSSTITRTLYVFPAQYPETVLPDASEAALYALINNAQSTVDMTMYELQDTTFSGDLVADCTRGVKVRVILSSSEKSSNTPAYNQLNTAGANCSAVFSNTAFTNTHQKTITVDNTTTAILSLNLQTQYYTTTRDYALVENDPADIAAIEATFAADYAAGTPYGGTQGASDFSYMPGSGDTTVNANGTGDLIWSPTTADPDLLGIINGATSTMLVENEEMSDSGIVSAFVAACNRGVAVHVAMTNDSNEYGTEFSQLEAAGCGVHVGPDNSTALYIHGKAIVADYGLSTQQVYMGSINFSTASLTKNRELGMYITDPTAVTTLNTTIASDYALYPAY